MTRDLDHLAQLSPTGLAISASQYSGFLLFIESMFNVLEGAWGGEGSDQCNPFVTSNCIQSSWNLI